MKIGVLLHIFADTVAHQLLSGFNANVNLAELVNVTNNITETDETAAYKSSIQKALKLLKNWVPSVTPAIGHMMIEYIPDLTHLSFTMEYTGGDGQKHRYTRSNTAEFIQMSGKSWISCVIVLVPPDLRKNAGSTPEKCCAQPSEQIFLRTKGSAKQLSILRLLGQRPMAVLTIMTVKHSKKPLHRRTPLSKPLGMQM